MSNKTQIIEDILLDEQEPDRSKKVTKEYIRGIKDAAEYFTYLDYQDIETMTGLTVDTVKQYRYSGKFPEPDNQFGQSPVWIAAHVYEWMVTSGRQERMDKEKAQNDQSLEDTELEEIPEKA